MLQRFRFFLPLVLATSGMLALQSGAWAGYVANSLTIDVTGTASASSSDTTNVGTVKIDTTISNVVLDTRAIVHSTPNFSDLFNSTALIQNNTGAAIVETITFSAKFDSPLGPNETLLSNLTINTQSSGTWTASNISTTLNQVSGSDSAVNGNHNSSEIGSSPLLDHAFKIINVNGTYTLIGTVKLNLEAGAYVNLTLDSQVQAVPAPNSAFLALASVPMIGLFGWLRRRKANAQELTMSVA